MKRIAIQGIEGSFHDIAAHQFFGDEEVQLICCSTFEQVFDALRQDPTVIGMAAIENTIAGSLLHNYELLRDSGATIVGEHKLRIKHSFMCLPDDDWDNIQEVHSHPVALMQCRDFLNRHPELKVVEASDTAGAGRRHRDEQTQLHALLGLCLARTREPIKKHTGYGQSKHRLRPTPRRRFTVPRALRSLILQTESDEDPVTPHHRARMGIPVLR